jgi:hypothetical protein
MRLGGVPVDDRLVLRLGQVVNDRALASKLTMAYTFRSQILNFTQAEREKILLALDHRPAGLEDLYRQLLTGSFWRSTQRI